MVSKQLDGVTQSILILGPETETPENQLSTSQHLSHVAAESLITIAFVFLFCSFKEANRKQTKHTQTRKQTNKMLDALILSSYIVESKAGC